MTDAAQPPADDELRRIADATSHRVQPDDPYTEPPDSTVDDWLGQRVEREAERLDVDPDAPGAYVDDTEGDVPEPNEPA